MIRLIDKSKDLRSLFALGSGLLERRPGRAGFGRLAAACALSGVLLAVLPASAQPSGARERGADPAGALFEKGNAHYQADRFAEAEAAYRQAWELRRTYDIAANLGQAELRLGKEPEAAGHLAFAVRNWPLVGKDTPRSIAAARLDELRKKLGLLRIQVNVAEVDVTVDGATLRDSPVAPEVFVRPGKHKVRASRAGYKPAEVVITVMEGKRREVALDLMRVDEKPAPPLMVKRDEGSSPWPLILAGVGSAGFLGAGIGLTVAAQDKYAEADQIRATFKDEGRVYCARKENESSDSCLKIKSANQAGDTYQNLGTVGFAVGGAALAGTVLYYVLSPSKVEQRAGARVRPVITASQGGLHVAGGF